MTDKQGLAVVPEHDAPLTAVQVRANVNLIQQVLRGVMKKDVHYGIIPGTPKPSLWKPGAEKIATTFRLAPEIIVEDLSSSDEAAFRVRVRLLSASGLFIGEGVGSGSSSEEKYRWRKSVCDEEWQETPEDRRREKWAKGEKPYKIKQVRTNPADVANTVLKMAKKRALVDAVLTCTAASDVFDQDIEDVAEAGLELPQAPIARPTAKPQSPPPEKAGAPEPTTAGAAPPPATTAKAASHPDAEPPTVPPSAAGPVISEPQRKRFYAIAKGAGWENEEIKGLIGSYGWTRTEQITKDRYEQLCKIVSEAPPQGDGA